MSTTYRIETDKGSYEVEVDDSAQADASAPAPAQEMSFGQKAAMAGAVGKEVWSHTPMAKAWDIASNPPVAGSIVGGLVAGPPGMAAGAGLGQIGKRMYDISKGAPAQVGGIAPKEAILPMAQAAIAGLPEVGGVKTAVQKTAQELAARGVGIKGALLKRLGMDKARQVGQTMLDEGVVKGTSLGTEATLGRASDLGESSGQALEQGIKGLDDAGAKGPNPAVLAKKVYRELKPEYSGGDYTEVENAARKIHNTIMAHARKSNAGTFSNTQDLKEMLQELGNFDTATPKWKAKMYRQASGMVRQAMEDSVGKVAGTNVIAEPMGPAGTDLLPQGERIIGQETQIAPDVLEKYKKAKQVYGAAETATEGLTNRLTSEASSGPSLRGMIIAGGALQSGNVTPALEALGLWEATSRYGARGGASALNFMNNNAISQNVRQAVMSEFISRIRMKGDSNGK